jgi:uncharacterized protein YuzE
VTVPRLTRHAEEGTAYLALTEDAPGGAERQVEVSLSEGGDADVLLDVTGDGRVIGIEFLSVNALPATLG